MALSSDLDPVCGMLVDPAHPKGGTWTHAGKTYGFCNPRCRQRFAADPERYPAPELAVEAAPGHATKDHRGHREARHTEARHRPIEHDGAPASASRKRPASEPAGGWVCPMDPEVDADRPGACPRCGMALESKEPIAATATQWVCPMHPQIVRDAPGTCPICGMALEPRTVSLDGPANPELRDMQRRLLVATPFTVVLV
ncbi:MAG TPA: heavy metal-binding domain-containing protein, partial [Myxococcaceae bacterium]|nr:heavy metal-binding domain-containing protein [Myxococcaceae bacterium]